MALGGFAGFGGGGGASGGMPPSMIPSAIPPAPTSGIGGVSTDRRPFYQRGSTVGSGASSTSSVAPDPAIQQQQNAVTARQAQIAKNPMPPNYNNLVNQYNTLMGSSPLNTQIDQLTGQLRTSQAGQGQALDEDAARRGITGSGASAQQKSQLAAATEQALAGGTTSLQVQDILRKQGLLNTGNAIANTGLGAENAQNAFLLGSLPTAEAGAQTALGQGQLGLEQWQAAQNAQQSQQQLALQAAQQQIQAEMALMQSAGNLFAA